MSTHSSEGTLELSAERLSGRTDIMAIAPVLPPTLSTQGILLGLRASWTVLFLAIAGLLVIFSKYILHPLNEFYLLSLITYPNFFIFICEITPPAVKKWSLQISTAMIFVSVAAVAYYIFTMGFEDENKFGARDENNW